MNTLFNTLTQAQQIILDIVDDQEDFIAEAGVLSVNQKYGCQENALEVIEPTNHFIQHLPSGCVRLALLKFDTHFVEEYKQSPERIPFPTPHCVFGTKGWDLAINIMPLHSKMPVYIMGKNEFDMWGTNPTGVKGESIDLTPTERAAYNNLFKVIPLTNQQSPKDALVEGEEATAREAFMEAKKIGRGTVILLGGVASDVCDAFAIAGYLRRGASVIVLDDLCRGIGAPTTFAPQTGRMKDVVETHFAQHYPEALAEGRLIRAQSAHVLAALHQGSPKI